MEDGDHQSEHHIPTPLNAALSRWATARRLVDQKLIRAFATLALLIGAVFLLGGFKPTIWFWGLTAIFAIVLAVALTRIVLDFLFYREVLQDPWDG